MAGQDSLIHVRFFFCKIVIADCLQLEYAGGINDT